jgi:hypothetical protein
MYSSMSHLVQVVKKMAPRQEPLPRSHTEVSGDIIRYQLLPGDRFGACSWMCSLPAHCHAQLSGLPPAAAAAGSCQLSE